MASYRSGDADSFDDELRRRFASVPVQVPVDVAAVIARGRTAKRRQLGLMYGGIALVVVVAIVAVLVGMQYGQQHMRSGTFPNGVNPISPSSTPSQSPGATLPVLSRIQVNGTTETGLSIDSATLAAVQRFADDVADGNLDSIVTHCWNQPAGDLRARWSDETNRANALSWLVTPGVVGDWTTSSGQIEWSPTPDPGLVGDDLLFDPQDVASGYACPLPSSLTAAQATLTVQRLVDRHAGAPLNPTDTQANYPLLSCDGFDMDSAWKGDYTTEWAASSFSTVQPVCAGITDAQWAAMSLSVSTQGLMDADYAVGDAGLTVGDFHLFLDTSDSYYFVFVAMYDAARDFPSWSGQSMGLYAVVDYGLMAAEAIVQRLDAVHNGAVAQPGDNELSCDGASVDPSIESAKSAELAGASPSVQLVCSGTTPSQWNTLESLAGVPLARVDSATLSLKAIDFDVFTPANGTPAVYLIFSPLANETIWARARMLYAIAPA